MNLQKAREAYRNDPQYHNLVELLIHQIETLQMSPSEIREAAMFACLMLEERTIDPMMVFRPDSEEYRKFVMGEWNLSPEDMKKYRTCVKPVGDGFKLNGKSNRSPTGS